jgi:mono/diheme cytochrome c family protein
MNNASGWILSGVATALLAAGCGDNREKPTIDAAPDADTTVAVRRGEYIVNVLGACSFCHTPLLPNGSRDLDKFLAGVDCFIDFDSPTFQDDGGTTGCLSSRNLTPHETGLKNATDAQIKNAFQNGIRTDGKKIVPIMPYWVFHNLTDDDADAIVAYLRSIPPVDHQVKANQAPASLHNDGMAGVFPDIQPLKDNEIPYPRGGDNNASAMNGRYLASMAGLCVDCHSPEVAPNALQLDTTRLFAGGKVFPKTALGLLDPSYPTFIVTRNLTSDATGLGGWTKTQIRAAIAEGRDKDNKQVCAATHGGVISPYAGLTPSDLDDIAEYLSLLPPTENDTTDDNCGFPPVPLFPVPLPEMGVMCNNTTDDDADGVPNDGCFVACGNCQGPTVP